MFRSRITLEEYLKFIQHEVAAREDVSLDDIDMIPNLEEEEVGTAGKNIFHSRVSINMNPSLISIPVDFKDDKEGDDVEENQRTNTSSAGKHIRDNLITTPALAKNNEAYVEGACQIENSTILRDKGGATHTSRLPHVLNQVSQQRRSARGEQNIHENTNTSGCSKQLHIARRLNFDQREQVRW
ncbi:hypothetical protein Cgig2_021353 [Carnegiea gigantea]|uniref:Uncharacterized protein n=1 Tax=Carnegiea gigantea TaxID=171969 RepID=A0A9Q1K7K0_9CARY|nr:hypothetical protein Cgig2_021353 [Carnegiea gigantea]